MPLSEKRYGVWLHAQRAGTLSQRGDYTWFSFDEFYVDDPNRSVLGLVFEEDLHKRHANALRLPPWFSNLLPEGQLRDWIARDRGVSVAREMELLAQVGSDLPGAVQVLPEDEPPESLDEVALAALADQPPSTSPQQTWRFSLAGIGLKLSMVQKDERLTLPAHGEGGSWIVKFPDPTYEGVPVNENAMMTLAGAAGIDTPEHRLVPISELGGLPPEIIQSSEKLAYAVRRFDRPHPRRRVHIEDMAQVRNVYPDHKYDGTFETLASLLYRGHDLEALRQFARRLTFNILISNGDAHLKNWSLIYHDGRVATLAPAYDLVSTEHYRQGDPGDALGLRFNRSRRAEAATVGAFERLEERLEATGAGLRECVLETIERVVEQWPLAEDLLGDHSPLRSFVRSSIESRRASLMVGSD